MNINLANRPEGATHAAADGRSGCWYKQEDGKWFFIDFIDDEDGDARIWTPCVAGPAMPPVELPEQQPEAPQAATGGPAFPTHTNPRPGHLADAPQGMTLRDYFAAKAMQGLMANPGGPIQKSDQCGWTLTNCTYDDVAEHAYSLADAMIAARGDA